MPNDKSSPKMESAENNQRKGYMPRMMFLFGEIFILLGVGAYVLTGYQSITALIPAIFGFLLTIAYVISKKNLKLAGHFAAVVGLLGFLGTARSLGKLPALLTGQALARPSAVIVQIIFAILCLIFIGLCVKWFIDAKKARQ